jgi:hypothetical protein
VFGADTKCQIEAEANLLSGTYYAWISDGLGTSPSTHFINPVGPYVRADGTTVAGSWADLIDGELTAPISTTAYGKVLSGASAWTNTDEFGAASSTDGQMTCHGWMIGADASGISGSADATGYLWTRATTNNCALHGRLYCFQQSET